jgi:hypothetical protein
MLNTLESSSEFIVHGSVFIVPDFEFICSTTNAEHRTLNFSSSILLT